MLERRKIEQILNEIQLEMKELEIGYERYFSGVEKREPQRNRIELAKRIRQFTNRPIFQTDIKFRYQGLASRFYSYSQYWDRILRLMEEGKYHRHLSKKPPVPPILEQTAPKRAAQPTAADEVEQLLQTLNTAREKCGQKVSTLTRDKVGQYLATQRQKVEQKFGDRPIEFIVDISSGQPQIKVRLKKGQSNA